MIRAAWIRPVLMIAAMLAAGGGHAAETANPLGREMGRSRPLVVVVPDAADPVLAELHDALAQPGTRAALADRQIIVFTVVGGVGAREDQPLGKAPTAIMLAALGLRADGPAAVLLVGKDGGVKMRLKRVAVAEILATVDGMPMRRQEMGSR